MNASPKIPCPRPEVLGGPVPYLMVEGALRASELYQRAFGAREAGHIPPDDKGRTMHVHLYVNGGSLMLSDAYPEHGCALQAASGLLPFTFRSMTSRPGGSGRSPPAWRS